MTAQTLIEKQLAALADMDSAVLDIVAQDGDTTLLHGAFSKEVKIPKLQGGWVASLSWENSRVESIKKIILLPGDDRTRQLWKVGQMKVAEGLGLTTKQATAWVNSRAKQKHELLPKLVEVLKKPDLVKAYLNTPTGEWVAKTDPKTKKELKDANGDIVYETHITHDAWEAWVKENKIPFQMYDSKHANLAQLVCDATGYRNDNRYKPKPVPNPALSNALLAAQARIAAMAKETPITEISPDVIPDPELDQVINGNVGAHPSQDCAILDADTANLDDRLAAAIADAGLATTNTAASEEDADTSTVSQ